MSKTVLVVGDSLYVRLIIKMALEENGFEVVGEASNGITSIELAKDLHPDLIVLDSVLSDMLGIDVLDSFNDEGAKQNVILMSSMNTESNYKRAKDRGVVDFIVKPFSAEELLIKARRAVGE